MWNSSRFWQLNSRPHAAHTHGSPHDTLRVTGPVVCVAPLSFALIFLLSPFPISFCFVSCVVLISLKKR